MKTWLLVNPDSSMSSCRWVLLLILAWRLALPGFAQQGNADLLLKAVQSAKAGQTITLPAGTFTGGVVLPAGVRVHGAGYGKTVIDAGGKKIGIAITGGKGGEIADLTVRGAQQANIRIADAVQVSVRRVCSQAGLTGIVLHNVTQGRLENLLVADNLYGIVVGDGRHNALVNCTMARNATMGLSLPSGVGTVAFNNVITESATGVYVGTATRDLHLDYNLYFTLLTGKVGEQGNRAKLGDWQYISGYDAHSVQFPVTLRDPKAGDYHPTNALDWALSRVVTADWGIGELAGVKAPATDIDGAKRNGAVDLGVYETTLTPPRPADGSFRVTADAGIKSAGIFTKNGRLVAYLFHNLPLRKGSYPFWFPLRTFEGKPIATGDYEVHLVESDLRWEYLGEVGDSAPIGNPATMAPFEPETVIFDGCGHLLVGTPWCEDDCSLRVYNAANGHCDWYLNGRNHPQGMTVDAQGHLYVLRPMNKPQGQLLRMNPTDGTLQKGWGTGDSGQTYFDGGFDVKGMTELNGTLYFADPVANAIQYCPTEKPGTFTGHIPVAAPTWVHADRKTNLLWCISGGKKLVALKPDGTVVAEATPTPDIAAMSVYDGTLAVVSRTTGKVHLFDATDPKQLRPTRTLGRGDGPYGFYLPDRFTFQGDSPVEKVDVAVGPGGDVAVVDDKRVLCFDAAGTCRWSTFGLATNAHPSNANPLRQYYNSTTIQVDEKTGTWKPEGYWKLPLQQPGFWKLLGDFKCQGKTILVYLGLNIGPERACLVQFWQWVDTGGFKPLVEWQSTKDHALICRRDTNNNGQFDAQDQITTTAPPQGGLPFAGINERFSRVMPNGDLYLGNTSGNQVWASRWPCGGLDAQGIPIYRFADRVEIPKAKDAFISPHTYKVDPSAAFNLVAPTADGGLIGNFWVGSSPYGTGWSNNSGTDLARVDAKGDVRWFHSLGAYTGTPGLAQLGSVTIIGVCDKPQILAFDEDGLGLGSCGLPAQAQYDGFWIDYEEALQGYIGADGQPYALIGDNIKGCGHWYRLHGQDKLITLKTPVHLAETTAAALQAVAVEAPKKISSRPSTPTIHIPHLAQPLPIDGDLMKWRTAGIAPQILITPETGGGVKGPKDCSAIVRVAYEGKNLYFQILQFDDVVSFHQPSYKSYLQDNVEITINSFPHGFKFMCSPTIDMGLVIPRQNGWHGIPQWFVPADLMPRVVKVLDNARDVPERELIESIYGEDMRDCKVIITEIKLPITEATYQGYTEALFPVETGKSFWLGFMIDDNDKPGTDVQHCLVWPATHGTFVMKEDSAFAIFD